MGSGTVEEITRGDATERGLLLDLGPEGTALLAGTEIWLGAGCMLEWRGQASPA